MVKLIVEKKSCYVILTRVVSICGVEKDYIPRTQLTPLFWGCLIFFHFMGQIFQNMGHLILCDKEGQNQDAGIMESLHQPGCTICAHLPLMSPGNGEAQTLRLDSELVVTWNSKQPVLNGC